MRVVLVTRLLIPWFLSFITGPRYLPEIRWSKNCWTHNVFRVYELIFGRRYGVRCEMSTIIDNGKPYHYAHTWEASVALFETLIRELLSFRLKPFRIYIPVLQTPQGFPALPPPYIFAIGFDNTTPSGDTGNNNISISHTSTGSDLLMVASVSENGASDRTPAASGVTYASVGFTTKDYTSGAWVNYSAWYHLYAPATGSNTFAITWTGAIGNSFNVVGTYSGASQSGYPDSSNGAVGTLTSITATTTVVAADCWLVGMAGNGADTNVAGAGTIIRDNGLGTNSISLIDSDATVGTGSQSLVVTWGGSSTSTMYYVSSMAPAGGGAATTNFLSLLGVGT